MPVYRIRKSSNTDLIKQGGNAPDTAGIQVDNTSGNLLKFCGDGATVQTAVDLNSAQTITSVKTLGSGGVLDTGASGALKINGTQVTSTAAELNVTAGVTAGTAAASKAVVTDANTAVAGLKVGLGAGATATGAGGSVGSLVDSTSTASGTVQSTEYTLNSVTIKANSFNANTRSVSIQSWGTTAANANAKNLKLYFGSTAICTVTGSTASGKDYICEGAVVRVGSAQQSGVGWIQIDTATNGTLVANGSMTESDTADIVVSVKSANTAAAAASATGKGMVVLFGN